MPSYHVLGLSLLCLALQFTSSNAQCEASTSVVTSCIKGFSLANNEARHENDNTCHVEHFKENCLSVKSFGKCLGEAGRSMLCAEKVNKALKDEGFECSYKAIGESVGTCGGSFAGFSIFTLIITSIWTKIIISS